MNNPIFNFIGGKKASNMAPLMQLVNAMSSGQNPINALMAINPQMAQQLQGKTPQELESLVRAEYQKRGVDIDATLQQLQNILQFKNF